jgi:hypothetical protein
MLAAGLPTRTGVPGPRADRVACGREIRLPIVYRLDPAAGSIETSCEADVTLDEVLEHFAELASIALPERLDVLLDLTPMTSLPDSAQIRVAADTLGGLRNRTRWGACAIVAKHDALFGMSRMFGVYTEPVFEQVQVFREREEAKRWLGSATRA